MVEFIPELSPTLAPAVFRCLINGVLQDMLGKFVITYIGNILIYSTDNETHAAHVKQVLAKFLSKQLHIKGEKCEFHVARITFIGYIIGREGLLIDQFLALPNWPTLKTVKELQCFLGFTNFYRRFIQGYSIIASPLTTLLKIDPRSCSGILQWTKLSNASSQHSP